MLEPSSPESGMTDSLHRVARGYSCRTAPKRCLQKGPSRGGTSKIADPGVAGRDGTRRNGGGRGEYISQEDPGFTWGLAPRPRPVATLLSPCPHPENRKPSSSIVHLFFYYRTVHFEEKNHTSACPTTRYWRVVTNPARDQYKIVV